MQYCSLQHRTLLLSPVTFTAGYCFCFGSIPLFFLELFLHWCPVAYWAPTKLGSSPFCILSFCLDGVITHLEPDILDCEVKWALESITTNKASGGDGIPVGLFHPKRWCCESPALNMPANLSNSAVATGLEKVRFHSNPKERQCQRMLKLLQNCTHLTR